MRWVFFTLVLANLALSGWFIYLQPESTPEPVRVNQVQLLQQAARPLQLLSELSEDDLTQLKTLKAERIKMQAPEPEQIQQEPTPMCTIVGPFSALVDAQVLLKRIRALELEVKLQELEIEEGPGYWVYMGPMASQKEALQKLKEVRRQKIDSYVVTKGPLVNSVSFGVFSRKELADSRLAKMRKAGLDAKTYEFVRSRKENWLMLPAGEVEKLAQNLWQELLRENSSLQMRQNYCPGVAKS